MATTGVFKGTAYSKLLHISSKKMIPGGTSTNFMFNAGQELQNIIRVSTPTCSFLNTFYNIVNDLTGNNTSYTYTYNGGGTIAFTLTPGYYSLSSILGLINADLVTNAGGNVSFSINSFTNKITITNTSGTFVINPGVTNDTGLLPSLGASPSSQTSNVTLTTGKTLTFNNMPALSGPLNVWVKSATLAPANGFTGDSRFSNTLLAMMVTSPWGTLNTFECKQDNLCEIIYSRPRDLSSIDIQLVDINEKVLNLNGADFNLELRVWFNNM